MFYHRVSTSLEKKNLLNKLPILQINYFVHRIFSVVLWKLFKKKEKKKFSNKTIVYAYQSLSKKK